MSLKEAMTDMMRKGRERNNVLNKNFIFNGLVKIQRETGGRSLSLYCIVFNLLTCCYSMNVDITIENNV
jgi:hypothetical protein